MKCCLLAEECSTAIEVDLHELRRSVPGYEGRVYGESRELICKAWVVRWAEEDDPSVSGSDVWGLAPADSSRRVYKGLDAMHFTYLLSIPRYQLARQSSCSHTKD